MQVRKRNLPYGWYPLGSRETREKIESLKYSGMEENINAIAGIVPHAGWEFSGKLALHVFLNLAGNADAIVVAGGHLPAGETVLAAFEDAFETPLGLVNADKALLEALSREIHITEDAWPDNTVEIQLPFIRYCFPDIPVVWMRVSPSEIAIELGQALYRIKEDLDKNIVVVGSTDLTHYGFNYGFNPRGTGKEALQWVKEVNDKHVLDALLEYRLRDALDAANNENSACSVGGAVAAASFARQSGADKARLLDYYTSYDVYPSESFVGYGGIVYS